MTIRRSGKATPEGRTLGRMSFRASLPDTLRANKKAMAHYAVLSGRDTPVEQAVLNTVKDKIERGPRVRNAADEPLEHDEQKAVCSWWFHYSKTKQLDHRLLVAVPNAQALLRFADNPNAFIGYLKAEGMRVGMLDLCLFVARGKYHGLIIEMKRKTKGVVSDDQDAMMGILITQGYLAGVCRGADEAIAGIQSYLETP